jgi:hypothetical protein
MSCPLPLIKTISRCVLLVVLGIAATPLPAFSQSSDCHPIRRGETAMQLARRLTGDGRNTYQPWFQIMDASSRFIPKSQYARIRPGWRACIVKQTVESSVRPAAPRETLPLPAPAPAAESPRPVAADVLRPIGGVDLTWVWLGAAAILPLFGWKIVDDYASRRRTASIVMTHFAQRFVSEFERPLIQEPADRPVRSRLRLSLARSRLEILLAPGAGRRYPNLSDHKKNVEYDVVRIVRLLADDSFVRDPLYEYADWVVVPFRFKVRSKRTGVACISSY